MEPQGDGLKYAELTDKIVGVFFDVYNELSHGFLESVYEESVENLILLELKCARVLERAHDAQLLHYLRSTNIEVGLLLNFDLPPQFRRLLFDNERKKIRENPCKSVAKVSA